MTSSTIALEAINLSKSFTTESETLTILDNINLSIHKGETVAITGPSGIGKTTLLHVLGTLDTPTSGELKINGELVDFKKAATLRNHSIGFIFQGFHLLEDYSVMDNILFPAKIGRIPTHKNSKAYLKALELLELFGLSNRASFLAKLLSGGEKQRVAIARALLNDPPLLLADEPTGNLDENHAKDIHQLLISSAKQFNKALIIVTHHPHLCSLCDTRYALSQGKLTTT